MSIPRSPNPAPVASGSRRLRLKPKVFAVVLIAVELVLGVAILAAAGGFRAAPAEELEKVDVGEAVDAERWTITVRRAWWATKDPSVDPDFAPEGRFLTLDVDIEVTADESTRWPSEFQQGLRLELPSGFTIDGDVAKSAKFRRGAFLPEDETRAQVHPGLPERVRLLYELPARQSRPEQVKVVIYRWEYASGFLDESRRWWVPLEDPEVAQVTVPVREGPP